MLAVDTKLCLGDLLLAFGQGFIHTNSIKSILANQPMFILEHAFKRLVDECYDLITKDSLKKFLEESSIIASLDELETLLRINVKFGNKGMNLSE